MTQAFDKADRIIRRLFTVNGVAGFEYGRLVFFKLSDIRSPPFGIKTDNFRCLRIRGTEPFSSEPFYIGIAYILVRNLIQWFSL